MSERRRLCTFRLGRQWFGVDVASVQEVLKSQPLAQVRWAGAAIRGLINLRGQIVTAIDLGPTLGSSVQLETPVGPESGPAQVVVRAPGASSPSLSLCVDEIGDVADVDSASFERTPATYVSAKPELIRGVYKTKDRLLLALDLSRVMHAVTSQGVTE